jgi:hypothetical protein
MEKPIKPKPHFYAHCFAGLQEIAKEKGYNLLIHGSMNRDMDLVAVPWVDEPSTHADLLMAFTAFLGVPYLTDTNDVPHHFSLLPGGRSSYIIDLNRGGRFNGYQDEQYYLDISITPLYKAEKA